ncbi:hypothetical protein [Humibacter ginsenosidimutans]|uniref:Uncharacterized protein n=1 Tax=Humibacter ginsenosidimutans TaxID=2599293 RepID=A0A5B8M724_9MICO|nr:hypothetical protein [Humibacter ginsenosidimutans]QDZ15794.1 hypothetical protein FPZ11_14395 [Humibacter ginsenosidimutans]
MPEPHAYDMSQFQRIIGVENGRVTGLFHVLSTKRGDYHVKPVDVTVWDDNEHHSGRVLYSSDLTAFVRDGDVDIPPHMIATEKHADVLDAMGAMEAAILAATEAFAVSVGEGNTP